jgi:hypothetical protein
MKFDTAIIVSSIFLASGTIIGGYFNVAIILALVWGFLSLLCLMIEK